MRLLGDILLFRVDNRNVTKAGIILNKTGNTDTSLFRPNRRLYSEFSDTELTSEKLYTAIQWILLSGKLITLNG